LPNSVSGIAGLWRIWRSNPVPRFRFWANLHLSVVYHFNRFAFVHQLEAFPHAVSGAARVFCIWRSRPVPRFRLWVNLHLTIAYRFDPFVFLRQLKQFPNPVLHIAGIFLPLYSRLVLNYRFWVNLHFRAVNHFGRFLFLHQLKQFHRPASARACVWRPWCWRPDASFPLNWSRICGHNVRSLGMDSSPDQIASQYEHRKQGETMSPSSHNCFSCASFQLNINEKGISVRTSFSRVATRFSCWFVTSQDGPSFHRANAPLSTGAESYRSLRSRQQARKEDSFIVVPGQTEIHEKRVSRLWAA
jgi:hypothetical protein